MTTPFSWWGVGIASGPALMKTAGAVTQSASQLFGDLLTKGKPKANGLLEPNLTESKSSSASPSVSPSRVSLLDRLNNWVHQASNQFGPPAEKGDLTIVVDRLNEIRVEGQEPLRSQLESYLRDDSNLRADLLALAETELSPLQWLPNSHTYTFTLRLGTAIGM